MSPKTWAAMEVFLASIATEEHESMALVLIEIGATNKDIDSRAFARDLEKIFSSIHAGKTCVRMQLTDHHRRGENEPNNLIEDQMNVYICLMRKMKLLPSEDEPKQKLNRRSSNVAMYFVVFWHYFEVFFFFFFFLVIFVL
jgi:predicted unusual protein kinase regulating ubiquinone biosynthesis (AarF/ABC1/UbiB family)